MLKFIFKMINEEVLAWYDELYLYDLKLRRSSLTIEEIKENEFYKTAALTVGLSYLELERRIKERMLEEFRCFVIHGGFKTTNGKKWPNFYVFKAIIVKGEENRGYQEKAINLKFNPLLDIKTLREGGYLVVKKCDCNIPKIYEITVDEKGVKHYPYIWIDNIYCYESEAVETSI